MLRLSTESEKIHELLTRGVAEVYPSREALEAVLKSGRRLKIYNGIDPTAATLHIGHLASLQKLRQFQELGHETIMLIGDFTGMIGDPTGKHSTRKQLTRKDVLANAKRYKEQASSVLSFAGKDVATIRRNSEWWDKMPTLRFLELLSLITVGQLSERDLFRQREQWLVTCRICGAVSDSPFVFRSLEAFEGSKIVGASKICPVCGKKTPIEFGDIFLHNVPIFMHEFLYPALQGYDSVAMDVDVEIGGTDQTFNMLMGRDYMRKLKEKEKFVITVPLLADASGKKIGKSEGNMVELGADPENLFGQAMALPDGVIAACFEQCTVVPMAKVIEVKERLAKGENPRDLKTELAAEFVRMRYGDAKAAKAREAFAQRFQSREGVVEATIIRKRQFGDAKAMKTLAIVDFLVHPAVAACASKSDARRLVVQGGVRIGTALEKIRDPHHDVFADLPVGGLLIEVGKKRERFRIVPT